MSDRWWEFQEVTTGGLWFVPRFEGPALDDNLASAVLHHYLSTELKATVTDAEIGPKKFGPCHRNLIVPRSSVESIEPLLADYLRSLRFIKLMEFAHGLSLEAPSPTWSIIGWTRYDPYEALRKPRDLMGRQRNAIDVAFTQFVKDGLRARDSL